MIRTSLHHYLSLVAQQKGKPFSVLVQEVLARFAGDQSNQQLRDVYNALDKLEGLIDDNPIHDVATTINAQLYGRQGMWRADPQKTGLSMFPKLSKQYAQ